MLLDDKMAAEAMDCASSPIAVLKSEPQDPGVSDITYYFIAPVLCAWRFALE